MATIAICVWPLPGAMSAPLALAERLERRGHRVCFVSIPDGAPQVRQAGFAFEPVLAEIFPQGTLLELGKRMAGLSFFARLRELRVTNRGFERVMADIASGRNRDFHRVLDQLNPDLVLVSTSMEQNAVLGVLAHERGVPFAYISSLFYHYIEKTVPPLSSPLFPPTGPIRRMSANIAFRAWYLARRLCKKGEEFLGLNVDTEGMIRRLAETTRQRACRPARASIAGRLLAAPDFLLAAPELEFPLPARPEVHHLGYISPTRPRMDPFPWERRDPARKLLYGSLGTLLFLPLERQRALLQIMIDAAAARPDWQLVLATGSYVSPSEMEVRDSGAIVMERVPQIEILQQARLMITHAGANSTHECVNAGVPIIALPIGFDQPGCAARVVYHGLGRRGDPRRITAAELGQLIDEIAADQATAARCAAMMARLRAESHLSPGLCALEALMIERRSCAD